MAVDAEVVPKLPYEVPESFITFFRSKLPNLNFVELDLPYSEIDIILGAEHYEFILREEQRQFINNLLLRNTQFGYVVGDAIKIRHCTTKQFGGISTTEIDLQMQKFWELEDVGAAQSSNDMEIIAEHKLAEETFKQCYARHENGRFIVPLLLKPSASILHGSYKLAVLYKNLFVRKEEALQNVNRLHGGI